MGLNVIERKYKRQILMPDPIILDSTGLSEKKHFIWAMTTKLLPYLITVNFKRRVLSKRIIKKNISVYTLFLSPRRPLSEHENVICV